MLKFCFSWIFFSILLFSRHGISGNDGRPATLAEPGERIYVSDRSDPFAPVEVLTGASIDKTGLLMRDPSLALTEKKPINQKPEKIVVKTKKIKEKKLSFKPLRVSGRMTKPRLSFTQEALSLGRADEQRSSDFYERIFETAPGPL